MSNEESPEPLQHPLLPRRKYDQPMLYTPRNETYLRNMMENTSSTLSIACNPQSSLLFLAYKLRKAQMEMNGNVPAAVAGQAYDRKNPPPPIPRPVSAPTTSSKQPTTTVSKPKSLLAPSLWPFLVDGRFPKDFDFFRFSFGNKCYFPQPMTSRERSNVEAKAINLTIKVSQLKKSEKYRVRAEEDKEDEEKKASFENVPLIPGDIYKYGCPICDYETDNKSHLRRHHTAVHDLTSPYVCSVCKMEFSRIEKVRRHFMQDHPGEEYDPKLCHRLVEDEVDEEPVEKPAEEPEEEEADEEEDLTPEPLPQTSQSPKPTVNIYMRSPKKSVSPSECFKCPQCSYTTNNSWNLHRHISESHKTYKQFTCSQCTYKTNRRQRMVLHMKTHDKLTCIYCKCLSYNLTDFQQHVNVCGSKHRQKIRATQFRCKFCKMQMPNKSVLRHHTLKQHKVSLEFCALCHFNTSNLKAYKAHMEGHNVNFNKPSSSSSISCGFCFKEFLSELERDEHVRKDHRVSPKRCNQCSFNSSHASFMKIHEYLHENNTCTYKGCSFHSDCSDQMEAHLIRHGRDNHKPLPINVGSFKCPVCQSQYRYRKSYFHHMANHQKDVCCPLCHEVFYTVKMMKAHMETHHDHLDLDQSEPPLEEGVDQDPIPDMDEEPEDDDVIVVEDKSDEEEEEEEEEERPVSPIVIQPSDDADFTSLAKKKSATAMSIVGSKRKAVVVLVPLNMNSHKTPNGLPSSSVNTT